MSTRPYNPGPWYRQRNARIYEQARAMVTVDEIAAQWHLEPEWIEWIIRQEQRRREEPKRCPLCGKLIEE